MAAMPLSMTRRDTFRSPMFTLASVGLSKKPSSAICRATLLCLHTSFTNLCFYHLNDDLSIIEA